jgi:hypothetical protein
MFKERRERSSYPKIFISHKIEVRESSIHGLGVFAKERLEFHELIEAAPVVVFHKDSFGDDMGSDDNVELAGQWGDVRLDGLHDRHVAMDYVFSWKPPIVAFPLGWAGVYNHSTENPNVIFRQNYDYECLDFCTRRVIEPDEEITIRYVPYKRCGNLWFTSDEANSILDQPLDLRSDVKARAEEIIRHGEQTGFREHAPHQKIHGEASPTLDDPIDSKK